MDIFTLDHGIYFAIGTAAEYATVWAVARIKTLAKNPTATLSADVLALIEKTVTAKVSAALNTPPATTPPHA